MQIFEAVYYYPVSFLYLNIVDVICSRASGSAVVMDPTTVCKKTRRLRGRVAEMCRGEPALLREISKGVQLASRECQHQFRHRRWNCTNVRRSLKKVLVRGKSQKYCKMYEVSKIKILRILPSLLSSIFLDDRQHNYLSYKRAIFFSITTHYICFSQIL